MLAIFNVGGGEIILILTGALLLFGGKKLPELAKGLGQGIREFKKATGNVSEEMRHAMDEARPVASRRLPPAPADTAPANSQVSSNTRVLPVSTPDPEPATVITEVKF
jgi:sec-independent protein translocase protein TatA